MVLARQTRRVAARVVHAYPTRNSAGNVSHARNPSRRSGVPIHAWSGSTARIVASSNPAISAIHNRVIVRGTFTECHTRAPIAKPVAAVIVVHRSGPVGTKPAGSRAAIRPTMSGAAGPPGAPARGSTSAGGGGGGAG